MHCRIPLEDLAALRSGDVDPERARELRAHIDSCEQCRSVWASVNEADVALASLGHDRPSAAAILDTRRALREEIAQATGRGASEVMSLDQVAEFLKLEADELESVLPQLPAFEIAGRVRVRRQRLLEWIEQRELAYARRTMESELARIASADIEKGVA